MDKPKGRLLGVDFGESHVGLAVCDESQEVIFAKGEISDFGSLAKLADALKLFIEQERVDAVVFGLPHGESENDMTTQTERYRSIGKKLEEMIGMVPFYYVDEGFSTFEANVKEREIRSVGGSKQFSDHELAAVRILERFIS